MVSKHGRGAVSEGGGSSQRKQVIVGWADIPDVVSVAVLIFCVTYASLLPFSLNIYINHLCNWIHLHVESSWRRRSTQFYKPAGCLIRCPGPYEGYSRKHVWNI